jgi:hypothetical protein
VKGDAEDFARLNSPQVAGAGSVRIPFLRSDHQETKIPSWIPNGEGAVRALTCRMNSVCVACP